MTELVEDDTPSPPVIGGSQCVCVCSPFRPLTAGNTGQDTMWSEARRQLLEWDASVADGYKVSFPKSHPYPNTTAFPPVVIVLRSESESEKVSDTSRQNEKNKNKNTGQTNNKKMPRAQ